MGIVHEVATALAFFQKCSIVALGTTRSLGLLEVKNE